MATDILQEIGQNGYWPLMVNDEDTGKRADKILRPVMNFRSGDALALFELATLGYQVSVLSAERFSS